MSNHEKQQLRESFEGFNEGRLAGKALQAAQCGRDSRAMIERCSQLLRTCPKQPCSVSQHTDLMMEGCCNARSAAVYPHPAKAGNSRRGIYNYTQLARHASCQCWLCAAHFILYRSTLHSSSIHILTSHCCRGGSTDRATGDGR